MSARVVIINVVKIPNAKILLVHSNVPFLKDFPTKILVRVMISMSVSTVHMSVTRVKSA